MANPGFMGVRLVAEADFTGKNISGQVHAYTTKAIIFLVRFSHQIIFTCQVSHYCDKAYFSTQHRVIACDYKAAAKQFLMFPSGHLVKLSDNRTSRFLRVDLV